MAQPSGWSLANGRRLPPLLFVTCSERLAANIGQSASAAVVTALSPNVLDLTKQETALVSTSISAVQNRTVGAQFAGIVIVGGPDVVPQQRLDVLTPALAAGVSRSSDLDQFVVWSDDAYGASVPGAIATLPVSRIPDGLSETLVWKCLGSPWRALSTAAGVRNIARPFADKIWSAVPGSQQALPTSAEVPPASGRPYPLNADAVYLMLHGVSYDGKQFLGENIVPTPGTVVAMDVSEASNCTAAIVFTGCCWGGMTSTTIASASPPGSSAISRQVTDSLALTFLEAGALAFLGCTGAHYSPVIAPYIYNGGPLHEAFWKRISQGEAPAKALFHAKYLDYLPQIPHPGVAGSGPTAEALERKIVFEYTCLGLGW